MLRDAKGMLCSRDAQGMLRVYQGYANGMLRIVRPCYGYAKGMLRDAKGMLRGC